SCGGRNGANLNLRTCQGISSGKSGSPPRAPTARVRTPTTAHTAGLRRLCAIAEGIGAVFEAKFMRPWSFSEEAAAEKYMAQVQHNMWVTHLRSAVLSIITGGGKWVEVSIPLDPLYLSVLVSAEKKFWRCVQSGEVPHLIMAEPPRPRIEAIHIVDMSSSNSWAEFAALFRSTRSAFLDHERAKSELKALIPEDAKEAIGHGVRAKRSKSGALSFDVLEPEASHAPV